MRRAVALVAGVLLMAGCTSSVDGRAATDAAAVPPGRAALMTAPGTAGQTGAPTESSGTGPSATDASATDASAGDASATDASATDASAGELPVPESTVTASPDEPPTANTPELPAGFYGADSDLGYRPMSTDEFDCTPDQASGCFGIMVFSTRGCPVGATVTVGIFDKAVDPVNPLGSASGLTPAIEAAGTQAVVIADSTGVVGQLTARVQSVTC